MKTASSFRNLVFLFLMSLLCFGEFQVYSQTLRDYHVEMENGAITKFIPTSTYGWNIVVPETLHSQTVIGIADAATAAGGAFYRKMFTSIQFPHTIQYLGDYSFYDSYLQGLNFSNCTTLNRIGKYAAYSTSLKALSLENCSALTNIETYAFGDNRNLLSVTLSGCSALETIEPYAFYNSTNNASLDLSGCSALTSIGKNAFYNNKISSLNLNGCNSIEIFSEGCFRSNGFSSLDLSACSNLAEIEHQAFAYNGLNSLDLSVCTNLKTIGSEAFYGNSIATLNLSANANLTAIGERAFRSNNLTAIDLSACIALTSIGQYAFAGNSLTSFQLPLVTGMESYGWTDSEGNSYNGGDAVTNFDVAYFVPAPYTLTDADVDVVDGTIVACSYNFAFKNIIIPTVLDGQTVTGIASAANSSQGIFANKGLVSVELPSSIEKIGDYAFNENFISNIDLSNNTAITHIGNYAFAYNTYTTIDLSANTNLLGIGDEAFYGENLKTVNITGCTSLLSIGEMAFYGNELNAITLPINTNYVSLGWYDQDGNSYQGGQTVEVYAIYKVPVPYTLTDDDVDVENGIITSCTYNYFFQNIIIPEILDGQTVVGIADRNYRTGVFYDHNLLSIKFPQTILKIGDYSFENSSLRSVDLSNTINLDSIGNYAFDDCQITNVDFSGCSQLRVINENAFSSCPINSIDLSSCVNLEEIAYSAFYYNESSSINLLGCTKLKRIGRSAFSSHYFNSLDLSNCNQLEFIGENAFYSNNSFSFQLPVHTEYSQYGWRDSDNNSYNPGDQVSNMQEEYEIPIPYTLTDADVEVVDGYIVRCLYDFERTDIRIPEILHEQVIIGIANKDRSSDGVFYYKGITSIIFPSTIQTIGEWAFYDNELFSLDFENHTNLDTIADNAFYYNSELKKVNAKGCSNLKYIGERAFLSCSIDTLNLSNCRSLEIIGKNAFTDNYVESLSLAGCIKLKEINDYAFEVDNSYGGGLTELDLSGCISLHRIGTGAFYDNPLESVNFYGCDSLTTIGISAFSYSKLSSLDLSPCKSLTTIEDRAFNDNDIETLNLSGCTKLKSIGNSSFRYNSLNEIDLSQCTSLTSVAAYAFANNSLTGFNLPTPEIPGFIVESWKDGGGNTHLVGTRVTNLNTNYQANLTKAILAKFWVSDGTDPLAGVGIQLSNIGTEITDQSGLAQFTTTTTDTLNYRATAPGYIPVSDSISVRDTFVEEFVVMTLCNDSIKIVETICLGDSVEFADSSYATSGIYSKTFTNQLGCDSIVSLHLTVNPSYEIHLLDTICEGDLIQIGDSVFNRTGTYTTVMQTASGCDSTVTLNLTVNPEYRIELNEEICEGEEFLVGNIPYRETGTYTVNLLSKQGCDSTVILNLTTNPIDSVQLERTICFGESVTIADTAYTATGIHVLKLLNKFGCDSVIQLDLTVNPVDSTLLNKEICFGEEFTVGDTSYSETGIHITPLSNRFLCDSIVTLNLIVHRRDSTELIESICEGEQFVIADTIKYSQTGIYTNIFKNQFGCDSTVVLDLTVIPKETNLIKTICEGEAIAVGETSYSESGNYSDTLQNRLLCDSIVNLNLTVIPRYTNISQTLCAGDTAFIENSFYTQTGIYNDTLLNRLGCDSIVILDLVVNRVDSVGLTEVICWGDSVAVGDTIYKETGTYTRDLTNVYGCDSIITLTLTVMPTHFTEFNAEVCEGDSYVFNDVSYDEQGTYIDTFQNQFGCDSIEVLNLTVNSKDRFLIKDTINSGETYTFRGIDYTASGLYADTLTNQQGCDSITSLLLYVYFEEVIFIPDPNFKAELLSNSLINQNNDSEIQVSEATGYSGNILVNNKQIKDLTGIEAFHGIDTLDCSNNLLDSLILIENINLLYLNCSNNSITCLNLNGLELLTDLICSDNLLESIEASKLEGLQRIECSNNDIISLDVGTNSELKKLFCTNNKLVSLDLRNGRNTSLDILATTNPDLTCVNVDEVDYAVTNWKALFDSGILFSTDCLSPDLAVKDISFTPGEVFPGDSLEIRWEVLNYGNSDAIGGWNERISLTSENGQQVYLNGNLNFNENLTALDTVSRNAIFVIPDITYFSGAAKVQVELIPNSHIAKYEVNKENNIGVSGNSVEIKELLRLEISETTVPENINSSVRCYLNRSGNSDNNLTVWLSTQSTDINLPDSIVIIAGNNTQPFDLSVNDNQLFDGDRDATVHADATGYNNPNANLQITDDDIPGLYLEITKDTIVEGDVLELKLSTNLTTDSIRNIGLSVSKQNQLEIPQIVSIPANENTIYLQIPVTSNSTPEFHEDVVVFASSRGYTSTKDTVFVMDDDVPEIQLIVNPETISETAGSDASWGKIVRTKDSQDAITFIIESNSGEIAVPEMVHLFPGEMEKTFSIGVSDNNLVDELRVVEISASVYVPACDCKSTTENGGVATASLFIADNDGPSLSLSCEPTTLAEGETENGTLTILRNTETSTSVLVALSHNMPGEITLQDTVSIKAGTNSVEIPIAANNDGVEDGQQTVSIMASAEGFSPGTINILTTDKNKPDLIISDFSINNNRIAFSEQLELTATIKNIGLLNASAGLDVRLYLSSNKTLSGGDKLLGTYTISTPIAIGDSVKLWELATLPEQVGNFYLLLQINAGKAVDELLYSNNMSEAVSIEVLPDFTVSAHVNEDNFIGAKPVTISGTAITNNSLPASDREIEVYIITQGIRRTIRAVSNSEGNYSVVFEPGINEVGHYKVGACFPGENIDLAMDEFNFMGFATTNTDWITWNIESDTPLSGTIEIRNFSAAELSNLTFTVLQAPPGMNLEINDIARLEGNGTATFNFTVTGTKVTEGLEYLKVPIQISSDEGVIFEFSLLYFCQSKNGLLKTEPVVLESSFTKGTTRYIEFFVYNVGAGNSGDITVTLPDVDWMFLASSATMESIGTGESSKVTLRLQTSESTELNMPMTGNIAINAGNSHGIQLPYRIQCVSEETGSLLVDVVDEYTYNTAAGPHVAGAEVKVTNPYTGEIVAIGETDSNGIIEFNNLPEGMYEMLVQAHQHDGVRKTIYINPGMLTEELIFISFQAISYTWTVVPTEIEDEYEIVLNMVYETNVPKPVVEAELPKIMPELVGEETFSFMITLINHGLITAEEVDLGLPVNDLDYEFVFLDKKYEIPAKQSIQIPVVMKRKNSLKKAVIENTSLAQNATSDDGRNCVEVVSYEYVWECGPDQKYDYHKKPFRFERCDDDDDDEDDGNDEDDGGDENDGVFDPEDDIPGLLETTSVSIPTVFGGGGGIPGVSDILDGATADSGSSFYDPTSPDIGCDPCIENIVLAIGGCAEDATVGAIFSALACAYSFADLEMDQDEFVACIIGFIPVAGCINGIINTAIACYGQYGGGGLKSASVQPTMSPLMENALINLDYLQLAIEAKQAYLSEFWGTIDYKNKNNISEFAKEIHPFISAQAKFSMQDIVVIKQNLSGTDITNAEVDDFTSRWNQTIDAWDAQVFAPSDLYPNILDMNIAESSIEQIDSVSNYVLSQGVLSMGELYNNAIGDINAEIEKNQSSVCASVSLSITQKLVMTREAFRGTLNIFNGHETEAIQEFELNLKITNKNGEPANDLFQIETESLEILTGIDGTGNLGGGETGTATILFIPEKEAAPTVPQSYSFGGSISYIDPFTQTKVTKALFPVTLEVNPSPDLYLHYFMQRDIYGDDPLTPNIQEPIIPAELAVMIENNGFGDAKNVRIESAQPELIDNEKGLLIDFELIGSNLQGQPVNLGLINIDFGTIAARSATVGQWWFTSSLLGHFVDYSANLTHIDSRGNPSLSLISGVEMHELIKSIKVYNGLDDNIPDFLVNEIQDREETPDAIYLSQGNTVFDVYHATTGIFNHKVRAPSFSNEVTITPKLKGWNYIKLDDPGDGQFRIVSITRNKDGIQIPLENAWLTHITMPDGEEHVYENKFHMVDDFETLVSQSYTITWEPQSETTPKIVAVEGVPNSITTHPVSEITVTFNKEIDPASFNYNDLIFQIDNGADLADNTISVTPLGGYSYTLNFGSLTTADGYISLTISTKDISDLAGNSGVEDTTIVWLQSLSNPAIEEFIGVPLKAYNKELDSIQLSFNMEIDETSLTPDKFSLEYNGNSINSNFEINSADNTFRLFTLKGISPSLTSDGTYSLFVDLPEIRSLNGQYGVDVQQTSWLMDKTPPELQTVAEIDMGKLDIQHVNALSMQFSEKLTELFSDHMELYRNNELIDISGVSVHEQENGLYYVSDFGTGTYGEGSYVFKIKLNELTDVAGNYGKDEFLYSWNVDRTPPPSVGDVKLIPDLGLSATDKISTGDSVAISMLVKENNTKIEWYEVNGSKRTLLSTHSGINTGLLLTPNVPLDGGQVNTEIVCYDSLNNSVSTQFEFYLDNTGLIATIENEPASVITSHPDSIVVHFSEEIRAEDFRKECVDIWYNGVRVNNTDLQIEALNSFRSKLSNFSSLELLDGVYNLEIDISTVHKLLSGKAGIGKISTSWTIEKVNAAPVASTGKYQQVRQGQLCALDGTESHDPDGDTIYYNWYAPQEIQLINSQSAKPSFIVPHDKIGARYDFLLHISDGKLSGTDKTTVEIVAPAIIREIDTTICQGQEVLFGDQVLTENGEYTSIFTAFDGSDSTVTINLTVNPVDSVAIFETICEGESVAIGDSTYTETGQFVTVLENQYLCDSVVTLNLTVNPVDSVAIFETICEGESVAIGDSTYTETGQFVTVLENQYLCDSVVTLNLTVNPVDSVSVSETICEGESVAIGDSTYTETGLFITVLENQYLCDSIVTLDLIVNPVDSVSVSETICEGESVAIGDSTYTETGLFVTVLENQYLCDSVVTLDLTVNQADSVSIFETICEGEEFEIGNNSYSREGIYTESLINQTGCDSIVTLYLSVRENSLKVLNRSICEGETYKFAGKYYSDSGTYTETLDDSYGCDSVLTLNLVVHQSDELNTKDTIKQGETYIFNGEEYTESGVYETTYTNLQGCDSIVRLELYVEEGALMPYVLTPVADTALYVGDSLYLSLDLGNVIFANPDKLELMYSCDIDGMDLPSWIQETYNDSLLNLMIRPEIADTGCYNINIKAITVLGYAANDIFKLCINKRIVGVTEYEQASIDFSMYPNPTEGEVTIKLVGANEYLYEAELQVMDLTGRTVFSKRYQRPGERIVFNIENEISGVYLVILKTNKSSLTQRLILRKRSD